MNELMRTRNQIRTDNPDRLGRLPDLKVTCHGDRESKTYQYGQSSGTNSAVF